MWHVLTLLSSPSPDCGAPQGAFGGTLRLAHGFSFGNSYAGVPPLPEILGNMFLAERIRFPAASACDGQYHFTTGSMQISLTCFLPKSVRKDVDREMPCGFSDSAGRPDSTLS